MPLADRDIIITPNRGQSSEPNIAFRGADAASSATVTLRVYNSSTVGTISFEGNAGQLMSVVDSLSGTIFSVNDISGMPSIEVLDTGEIRLAQYSGGVNIAGITTVTNTTNASSTLTGALQVRGGAGIGGNLYVGGTIFGLASVSGTITTATSLAGGALGQIPYQTAAGATQFIGTGTSGSILQMGANTATFVTTGSIYVGRAVFADNASTASQVTTLAQTANATYFLTFVDANNATAVVESVYTTSSFTVNPASGGVRIGGVTTVTNTTSATSTETGAFQVVGGVGIGGKVWAEQLRQTSGSVAIGPGAGQTNQGNLNVAIGPNAGQTDQANTAIAIGNGAGSNTQTFFAIAIGNSAGATRQGNSSIAIGVASGTTNQGTYSIALGSNAGDTNQGANSIAIGFLAGNTNQPANSIIISASGSTQNASNSGLYINPVRSDNSTSSITYPLMVNDSTKEITSSTYFRFTPNTGVLAFTSSTNSAGTTTGALVVTGGMGIGGNLYAGLDGYFNATRIGRGAGSVASNTVLGNGALDSNSTGTHNTSIGNSSLNSNTTGQFNTAVGSGANSISSTGQYNITIGYNSGNSITTGTSNTIIGSVSGTAGMTGTVIVAAGTIERFRIDSVGNMGIGTTTPSALLDVNGTAGVRSATNATSSSTGALQVTGGAGIGLDLWVGGTAYANVLQSTSDINFKKDITTITNALNTVMQLRGVEYKWKHNDAPSLGLIAQEVQPLVPAAVSETYDRLTVSYGNMVGLLVEAIKEQQQQIAALQQEIRDLKQ